MASLTPEVLKLRWEAVLGFLKVEVKPQAFPAVATCPCCESQATVYDDHASQGQWFSCNGCGFAGPLLKLIKKANDHKNVRAAYRAWCRHVKQPRIDDLWSEYLQHSPKVKEGYKTWQAGLDQLERQPDMAAMLAEKIGFSLPTRCNSPGGLHEICRLSSQPVGRGGFVKTRTHLMLPFYTAPGCLVGLGFWLPKRKLRRKQNSTNREGGFLIHPGCWRQQGLLFVTEDLLFVLQLQARHLSDLEGRARSPKPLSLAGYVSGIEYNTDAWSSLADRDLVFLYDELTPRIFSLAVKLDARLARTIRKDMNAADWRRVQTNAAKPWSEAASDLLFEMSDSQLAEFVAETNRLGMRQDVWQQKLSGRVLKRLRGLASTTGRVNWQWFGSHLLCEQHDSWCVESRDKSLRRICDAVLRIDNVVRYARTKRMTCYGRVLYKGQSYPFRAPAHKLQNKPFEVMQETLLSAGAGLLNFDSKWNRLLLQVAQTFQQPVVELGADRLGWDSQRNSFVLPRFEICRDGEIKPLLRDNDTVTEPGQHLPAGCVLTPQDFSLGVVSASARTAALACVLAAAMSQLHLLRFGTAASGLLVGDEARLYGQQTFTAIGGYSYTPRNTNELKAALREAANSHWFTYLDGTQVGCEINTLMPADGLLLADSPEQQAARLLTGQWQWLLDLRGLSTPSETTRTMMGNLYVSILQLFASRADEFTTAQDVTTLFVTAERLVTDWWADDRTQHIVGKSYDRFLRSGSAMQKHAAQLVLSWLLQEGHLPIDDNKKTHTVRNVIKRKMRLLEVPKLLLRQVLQKLFAITPELQQLTDAFESAGMLHSDKSDVWLLYSSNQPDLLKIEANPKAAPGPA